jgi:hypothetical protein
MAYRNFIFVEFIETTAFGKVSMGVRSSVYYSFLDKSHPKEANKC